jgi:predicted MFS family arabinose efflux permease
VIAPRWRLLAFLTAAYAAGAFGVLGVSPLSPALLVAFGLSRFEVGLLLPAVYVGGLLVSLPAGRLADRFGARVCLIGGLALCGFMLAAGAAAQRFPLFLFCLVVVGIGWSIVNPALGRAIIELFPASERGVAMGIKQMGLTTGGIASAMVLPAVAGRWGWRWALVLGVAVAFVPALLGWRPLAVLGSPAPGEGVGAGETTWWWLARPPLVIFFAAGLVLGMVQSAVLGYLPLFATQGLGMSAVGGGTLLAVAQLGGTVARLGMGMASDRWLGGQRVPWLVLTALIGALALVLFAWPPSSSLALAALVAFWAGVGTFGWVGLYLVVSAEVGGREQAGLLTGVAMGVIFAGIPLGAPLFGLILEATDSYAAAWATFATLSAAVAGGLAFARRAIHRQRRT